MQDPMLRGRSRPQTPQRPVTYTPRPTTPQPTNRPVQAEPAPAPIPTQTQPISPQPAVQPTQTAAASSAPQVQVTERHGGLLIEDSSDDESKGRMLSRKRPIVFGALAAVVLVAGVFVGINALHNNRFVSAQIANLHKTTDPNAPSEVQPSANEVSNYKVPETDPQVLTINKIGVNARVQKVTLDSNNQLEAPKNTQDVGWYDGSSQPGQSGAVLLNGYVQGPTKPGVFANLNKLSNGDKLTLKRGDGQIFTYQVVKTQTFDGSNMDMKSTLNSADDSKNGLNLISSSGSQRFVVFAIQD